MELRCSFLARPSSILKSSSSYLRTGKAASTAEADLRAFIYLLIYFFIFVFVSLFVYKSKGQLPLQPDFSWKPILEFIPYCICLLGSPLYNTRLSVTSRKHIELLFTFIFVRKVSYNWGKPWTHFIGKTSLEILIFLFLPPKCCSYRFLWPLSGCFIHCVY